MSLSKKYIWNVILVILLFAVFYGSYAQNKSKTPIDLKYADSLVRKKMGGYSMKFCVGDVHFTQGNVLVWSDSAIQYEEQNRIKIQGNVKIVQGSLTMRSQEVLHDGNTLLSKSNREIEIIDGATFLRADSGSYSTNDLIAYFHSNVFIDDDSAQIWSDEIIYERETGNSFAYGNVIIKTKGSNTLLIGDTIEYYPELSYSIAFGSPQLVQIDSTVYSKIDSLGEGYEEIKRDTLMVESDTMESYREEGKELYIFKNNVRIQRNNVTAIASNAVFDKVEESITLYGKPVLWLDSTQLHADSIFIKLPKNQLDLIRAMGEAFAGTRSDSVMMEIIDQLSGEEIDIFFQNDSMSAIESYGAAKSVYFLSPEDGIFDIDKRSTDTIKVTFDLGEAEYIYWLGPTQHEYIPQNIIRGKYKEYYLPKFRWQDRMGIEIIIRQTTDPVVIEQKFKY